jgi:hypothetical protein
MTKLILIISILPFSARASTQISCNYTYQSFPFASVALSLASDGTPVSPAHVTEQGVTHTESVTPDIVASGEVAHVWLSKEVAANAVEMIVYAQATANGQSELINHNVPMGQDVWGTCSIEL